MDIRPNPNLVLAIEDVALRMTGQRLSLASYLEGRVGAFTAEEIANEKPDIGRATVYRTLRLLVESGVLCKTQDFDGRPKYTLDTDSHHHHIVCVECGDIREFRHPSVERMLRAMRMDIEGELLGHRLELYYRCLNCSSASSANERMRPKH